MKKIENNSEKFGNIDQCTLCGFCKVNCTSFKHFLNEKFSARGRAMMIKHKKVDDSFYKCTLCKACVYECPLLIDLELADIRASLVKKKIETKQNKIMIENVRKYGNPFGKKEEGKKFDKLYCC